jgi:multimeric flavodoxin WrbA
VPESQEIRAVALVCSLKPSPSASSSQLLADQVLEVWKQQGIHGTSIRVVDHEVKPGVDIDMGGGDAWPSIRQDVLAADIVLIATPTWLGQPSSICQRVLERLDAELGEKDEKGRLLTYGKVACAAVVGNEDGAHHISSVVFQAMNDLGFTLAAGAVTYWNGEAMQRKDYKDLVGTPEAVASTTKTMALNAAHLARLLKVQHYPSPS